MRKRKIIDQNILKRYSTMIVSMYFLAIAYNLFILPNDIVTGGVGGLAVLFKDIINPSIFILFINFILLIISYIILGKEETKSAILGAVLYPIFISLTADIGNVLAINTSDMILNIIFVAVISGVSIGLILKNGFSTGGSDIAAAIISKVFKKTIGNSFLVVDGLIILSGTLVFGPIKTMYAIIFVYIYSIVTDKIILGVSDNKAFYIITNEDERVKQYIINNLNSGVTILNGRGGYDKSNKTVIFCVVPSRNYFKLKEGIMDIDNQAFFIVTDAYEVRGGA